MPRRPTDLVIQRTVGTRLAGARRARAMTQEALAATLGIEPGTHSRYEQGRVPLTVPLLVLAAQALGLHPGQLFDGVLDSSGASATVEESELLALWRQVNPARREAVVRLLREIQDAMPVGHEPTG